MERRLRSRTAVVFVVLLQVYAVAAWAAPPTSERVARSFTRFAEPSITTEAVPAPHNPERAPRGLRLVDLEQMALSANPSVARAAALVGAARGNAIQAGLGPNPSVGYEGQQLGSGGAAEQHGVVFNQEIVRGGKLRLSRSVAQFEEERFRQDLATQQQRVLTDVRIAFYQVLVAEHQISLTDNLLRISRQGAATVDQLFRGKEASRIEVLQAQLEIENAEVLSRNARHRRDAAWRNLAALAGQPNLAPQPLEGDADAPPLRIEFEEALAHIQASSPEVAAAITDVSRARAALERARVEPIPNLNVQGLVNIVDNGIGGNADGGVALTMPIPLFNRNQGAILRAQHEVAASQRALQQVEIGIQSRLAPVFERYANARNQVERYRGAILPTAQESLDLTHKTYQAGEANYLLLLTAQRTFSQTNLNYLDAVRELRTAEAEIEGLLLSGSVRAP